jgi:predicted DNA-binding transcriptional regulator AlpA
MLGICGAAHQHTEKRMKKNSHIPNAKKKKLNLMTLKTFLLRNEISRSTFYKLKKARLAPREIHIGRAVYISAREEWRWTKKMSAATLVEDSDKIIEI